MRSFKSLPVSNLSDNNEKETCIKDFGGVDYSHSTVFVDTSRATDMSNFIKENGISQKRKGWREIYQFPFDSVGSDITYKQINGVWDLTTSEYNSTTRAYVKTSYTIVQAKNKFYSITKTYTVDGETITENGLTNNANDYSSVYTIGAVEIPFPSGLDYSNLIVDDKSSGFISDERLYVLCGSYFMIGKFGGELQIRKVEDDTYTYIPTTCINIPPNEYNDLLTDTSEILKSYSFDEVNMLNRNKYNQLQGLAYTTMLSHLINYQIKVQNLIAKQNDNGTYYVNSNGTTITFSPETAYLGNASQDDIVYTYDLDSIPFEKDYIPPSYSSETDYIEKQVEYAIGRMIVVANGKYYLPNSLGTAQEQANSGSNGICEVVLEDETISSVASQSNFYSNSNKIHDLKYYVSYNITSIEDGIPYGTCKLTFNHNVVPSVVNSIKVQYKRYTGQANRINGCSFGLIYNNVLFLSGNSEYPNIDYHTVDSYLTDDTSNVSSKNSSFTYFGDLSYTKIGGTTNSINGYAILGDSTIAIFKTLSGQEPTIYFRTKGTIDEDIEDVNGNSYTKETIVYPITVGTIGEGSIGFNTIHNLNGDTLMLGNNGVFGIELDTNVASSQRLAKRRSRLIDSKLNDYDLSKAVCTTFDDKFMLCDSESGKCFIADSRYCIKLDDDLDGTYQYEWWVWDNIPARIFFHHDNKLWFGTETGMLCCFENSDYQDITSLDITTSGICYIENLALDYNDKFVVSPTYISSLEQMSLNDSFINSCDLYALIIDTNSTKVSVEEDKIIYDYSDEEDKEQVIDFFNMSPNYTIEIDHIPSGNINVALNTDYKIYSVLNDEDNETLTLCICTMAEYEDESEGELTLGIKGFRLCAKLNNVSHSICNVGYYYGNTYYLESNFHDVDGQYYFTNDNGEIVYEPETIPKFNIFSIRDYTNKGEPLKICNYNNVSPVVSNAKFVFNKNVYCYYITPPFDFGTRLYNKDLRKLIIVPDTLLGTRIQFGFETKDYTNDYEAYTGKGFSFDDIDFDNLNFNSESFASVYVKIARKKRWSYIRFFFKSDTNDNCKINNLTIIYTKGTKNRGIR